MEALEEEMKIANEEYAKAVSRASEFLHVVVVWLRWTDMYVSVWNGRGLAFASFGGSEVDAI